MGESAGRGAVQGGWSTIENIKALVSRKKAVNSHRIEIMDAVRGIAILAMIIHHTMFDIEDIFGHPVYIWPIHGPFLESTFFLWLRQPFTWAFILLAGVSCRFSHNNWLRGLKVLAVGLLLTLFTWVYMPSELIVFGILHFMGVAILLFALLGPLFDRIPTVVALPLWTLLFAFTFTTPDTYIIGIPGLFGLKLTGAITTQNYLFALGIPSTQFFSADYFPLMPWFFLFMIGTIIGKPIRQHKLPEKFYTAKVPFFAFAGRHTLLLYLVHQPLVYGILTLIFHFHLIK